MKFVENAPAAVVGARQLGTVHERPEDVNREFAGIYTGFMRGNPM